MRTLLTFILCIFLSFSLMAAETLTFKLSNPRIENFAPDDYLVFDVLVKASANGTYLYGSQVICNINLANFNSLVPPSVDKGFIVGTYDPPGPSPALEKYTVIANYNSGNLNIAILPNVNFNSTVAGAHSEITTSWQTLVTVYCLISNTAGSAGISFKQADMNGQQTFATGLPPLYSDYYNSPNLYEGYDFTDLYLARIFSGGSGWTQIGGTMDWTASVNTSVWDTTTTAAVAGAGALAADLRIHTGGRLLVNPAATLTVAGTLTNAAGNNGLVIKSDASGTGSLIHNTNNVPATIQRYITGSSDLTIMKYHFVSVPLMQSENPVSGLFLDSYLFGFNEATNDWVATGNPTNTPLYSNRGYMVYYPNSSKTYVFAGTMNNGSFSVPVTSSNAGYNLAPNPYPSAIDWDAASGWTKTNVDNAVYVWPSNAGFGANQTNYASYIGGVSLNSGSRYIAQGQSFFVHATASTSLVMNNNARVHNAVQFFKDDEIIPNVLRIKSAAGIATDEIAVRFSEGATSGFDGTWDAYKLTGGENAPQLNTVATDNSKLAINSLPFNVNETVVPINFSFSTNADITFTASGLETFSSPNPIYLEDQLMSKMINLDETPVYTFSYQAGSDVNRFKLHFTNVIGIGELAPITEGKAYITGGKLYIEVPSMLGQKTEIRVYNTFGQQLCLNHLTMNNRVEVPFAFAAGVYVIHVESAAGVFLIKVVNN